MHTAIGMSFASLPLNIRTGEYTLAKGGFGEKRSNAAWQQSIWSCRLVSRKRTFGSDQAGLDPFATLTIFLSVHTQTPELLRLIQ